MNFLISTNVLLLERVVGKLIINLIKIKPVELLSLFKDQHHHTMNFFNASSLSSSVFAFAAATAFTNSILGVSGHGYMFQPSSRNYYSNISGKDYGLESGVPIPREYCYHCLNTNTGVCGTSEQGTNYDEYLDSLGQPMPWITQASYEVGDTITIGMELKSHHLGHMELRGCPVGNDNGRSATQDCFDEHILEFVEDISYQMPKDEDHPERGYFYGGSSFGGNEFSMKFKLPLSLSGEKVLLQWFYYTANSCSPPGYYDYFAVKNTNLPSTFWGGVNLSTCTSEQFPGSKEFFTGDSPERFVNCAEVTIGGGGGDNINPSTSVPTGGYSSSGSFGGSAVSNSSGSGLSTTSSPTSSSTPTNPSPTNAPVNRPTVTTTPKCECESCTQQILDSIADGYSCGSRIDWVASNLGFTESNACKKVGGDEYPTVCGACNPSTCNNSNPNSTPNPKCECESCTQQVLDSIADGYSCGARIDWVASNLGYTENNACKKVGGDEYPTVCGACNPSTCN